MQRHPLDVLALIFGLAFVIAGGAFVIHEATGNAIDAPWVAAVGFIALGAVALVTTLLRARDDRVDDTVER